MRRASAGVAFVLAALSCAAAVGRESAVCADTRLADRAREANRRDPHDFASLSDEDRQLSRIDLLITQTERRRLWECLDPVFARLARTLPATLSAYRTWNTDADVHYFPGNDFSSGKIFANAKAVGYFDGARRLAPGAILVKETFSIDVEGNASVHEIAAMVRHDTEEDEGWLWLKLDAAGNLTRPASECLTCHRRAENPNALFGFAFVTRSR